MNLFNSRNLKNYCQDPISFCKQLKSYGRWWVFFLIFCKVYWNRKGIFWFCFGHHHNFGLFFNMINFIQRAVGRGIGWKIMGFNPATNQQTRFLITTNYASHLFMSPIIDYFDILGGKYLFRSRTDWWWVKFNFNCVKKLCFCKWIYLTIANKKYDYALHSLS